jgi:hypothetical protein
MEFIAYQFTGSNPDGLVTGSYLNQTEVSLFVNGYTSDLWYGASSHDVIELGVWDRNEKLLGWTTLNQSQSYNAVTLSYNNALNSSTEYTYSEFNQDFIMYKNNEILVNPTNQISSSFGILEGSYFVTYNFTREMAGTMDNPLVIKEISPSRKELKLVPLNSSTPSYEAFCKKNILLSDVSSLYLQTLKNCPYEQIYNKVNYLYTSQINTIKSLFFLNTDGEFVNFLKNIYEDTFIYSATPLKLNSVNSQYITGSTIRIQGIKSYFNNYLLLNSNIITNFSDINNHFETYTSASIERKFRPIGPTPSQQYVDAKSFVYDFFIKYFYNPISNTLSSTYNEKYFGSLRNSLNLGSNNLFPIVSVGMMDERLTPSDSLTLLLKLKSELPNDIMAQSRCWVSNVSFTPYAISAIFKNSIETITHKIGPPNFSVPISNISVTNVNSSYSSDDLKNNDSTDRDLIVSKNINELSVDYTNFNNFVVFSSAELRLKIFKNKIISISGLNSSLDVLNNKNILQLSSSGYKYPFYTQEYTSIQTQLNEVINSFDGYESYLYNSNNYKYSNGEFLSASYVAEMDSSASFYDKNNRDSMVKNCPEHVLTDSNNDDYIIFLSMIGHFFDEIYIYISNIPSERRVGYNATEEFTRRIVDYMLETFGWNLDDSMEQSNLINNYLTSNQMDGLNSMSSENRLKTIRNRILINLPQIYKTKGTEEAVRLILACYGIPSSLLNIREYGGVNYTDDSAEYTTYERVYMRQWDTSSINDTYYLQNPTGSKSFLFKFSIDSSKPYTYGKEQILFGTPDGASNSVSGSGKWAVGFIREPKLNTGKLFFRIGYSGYETFKMYSPEFPMFDGNIYSVMLRKNSPDEQFEYTTNIDSVPTKYDLYVQRNEFGNEILKLKSSNICYDTESIIKFGSGGIINLIGWFSTYNEQGYTGTFDKFQIWNDTLSDGNFTDYVNNINSYSFSGSIIPHKSLLFRMHTDYPFNQQNKVWQNANPYYATGSYQKIGDNVDYMVNSMAWSGSQTLVYDSASCQYVSQSTYPYQFKVIDYPSTWAISKYGPNKFRNEKVKHVVQSVETRLDDKERSTNTISKQISPDSNQVGLFVDPQDFKNRNIIRYFGDFNFMETIGDPSNQFSSSYDSLRFYRNEFNLARTQFSGSKTLFNELSILYKLYFNRSIFDAIKNVIPSRTNILTGVLIEPTILERPKYQSKEIFGELNSGSAYYFDVTASHYFRDTNTKIVVVTSSVDFGKSVNINLSYINNVNRNYPTNYGGNCIGSLSDMYSFGHFPKDNH